LHERVELRMEYEGVLTVYDNLPGKREVQYIPEHLLLGTKLMLWQGSTDKHLRWIPKTSMMLQLGIPTTKELVDERPVIGMIDLLFENEVTDWFSVGYDVGAHWLEWKPEPDVFASLSLNFQPTEQWGCFIENFNYFEFHPSAAMNTVYNVFLDFGITYSPHPRVQLDVNAGFNCYDSEPLLCGPKNFAFVGLGIAWKLR
ncbi:MAG: transporter, partial [Paludibacteraceae bacterium]|nr:transporter [Paludibacteraceae bacterium]